MFSSGVSVLATLVGIAMGQYLVHVILDAHGTRRAIRAFNAVCNTRRPNQLVLCTKVMSHEPHTHTCYMVEEGVSQPV